MPRKIYIDGQAGTTALRIREWLTGRDDIEVITLPEELRKDADARKQALRDATIVLLCLPDDAAKDAAASFSRRLPAATRSGRAATHPRRARASSSGRSSEASRRRRVFSMPAPRTA